MSLSEVGDRCAECRGPVIDDGDELVCSACGITRTKIFAGEAHDEIKDLSVTNTNRRLGSYMGSSEAGPGTPKPKGLSSSPSTYLFIKELSDYGYKKDYDVYRCGRLMERICEKLSLPSPVVVEGISIAKSVMHMRKGHGEVTVSAISAFSLINACKRLKVTSVGVKEIMDAHRNLGYRVKTSVINHLFIEGPVRPEPMRAEDYLASVASRLHPLLGRSVPSGYLSSVLEAARAELERVRHRGGHSPRSTAATAIYAGEVVKAAVERRMMYLSQDIVARCSMSTEFTIREQFVELFKPGIEARFGREVLCKIQMRQIQMRPPRQQTYLMEEGVSGR